MWRELSLWDKSGRTKTCSDEAGTVGLNDRESW